MSLIIDPSCRYLVIGNPIGHSLSPEMQNAAFQHHGLGSPYSKLQLDATQIAEFVELSRQKLSGFNVTVPHKNAIIPYLDSISSTARSVMSVNTVVNHNGKLHGDSTDGYGLAVALKRNFDLEVDGKSFLFIGAGGAARATAWYFAEKGAKALYLANRTKSNVMALAQEIRRAFPALKIEALPLSSDTRMGHALESSDCLLQCTSLGLNDDDPAPFNLELLKAKDIPVFDLIYRPTKLLAMANELNMRHASGIDMLLYQGARSFELWTEQEAPIEAMRKALEEAICHR